MAAEIRVNGKTFNLFKQIDGQTSIDTFAREIRIVASQPENNRSPLLINDFIEVFRDGIRDFTGHIEDIDDGESRSSHDISYRARSLVADLIDSSVPDNVKNLEGVKKYSELVQLCIDGLGLTGTIKVIDQVGAIFPDSKKIKAAASGDSCGGFLQENARIVQVFLNDDGDGNVVIRRPTGQLKTIVQNVPGAENNNIKKSNIKIDYRQRFNRYTIYSNSSLASDSATVNDLNNAGTAIDNEIRKTRIYEKLADKPMTPDQCKRAAEEEANIRRGRSFSYTAEIAGFSANGELWEPGPEVKVKDIGKGVQGIFLLNSVTWSFGGGGEIINLQITLPDKTTVQPNPTPVTQRIVQPSITYGVKSGDTLSEIAQNFGVSLESLVASNPQIENPNLIFPDQQLSIPNTIISPVSGVRIAGTRRGSGTV